MTERFEIAVEPDGRVCAAAASSILDDLPDWFGVPENTARYVESARDGPTWLARLAGRPIGVMVLERATGAAWDIHLLAIAPEWHRRGAGRGLVTAALDFATLDGARFLTVRTLGRSVESAPYAATRAAYGALGFSPLAELLGVWGDAQPMLLLARTVESE